jgi:ABC-type branched-subunit amino acid transport system ATPase component
MAKYEQQLLKGIRIEKLKHIKDLTIELDTSKNLTALIGINGCGKSSILHMISCLYHPPIIKVKDEKTGKISSKTEEPIFRFSKYLKTTPDDKWTDTKITMTHNYRTGKEVYENMEEYYSKTDRWSPKYSRRPQRVVRYLGIDTCVPDVELESKDVIKSYKSNSLMSKLDLMVIETLGFIMNRKYSEYEQLDAGRKKFKRIKWDEEKYNSLSMSAGEQRVLKILETIHSAPKYSMILIDEIDLLIHSFSLKRLLVKINEIAQSKKMQIIFTTHSLTIMQFDDIIDIKHIHNTPQKSFCLNGNDINLIERMSGEKVTQFEIFVEDNLSEQIVKKICRELKVASKIDVFKFGAASNCFSVAAGLIMADKLTDNTLLIIDGDVIKTDEEKKAVIKKVITGNTYIAEKQREKVLSHIIQYNLPEQMSPEKYIYDSICNMETNDEFIEVCRRLPLFEDPHDIVIELANYFNYDKKEVMKELVEFASKHDMWDDFTGSVKQKISRKILI